MKKQILVVISFALITISACSFAGVTPPKAVADAFNTKFPNATEVKWGMEDKTEYEAEFKLDGKAVSANFKIDGTWMETETSVTPAELPAGVLDYMKKNVPEGTIKETAKIESAEGTVYEVEIKGMAYLFDTSGKFLKSANE